ncbi:MAG: hypothetical protein ACK4VK_08420, partial [Aquificaceae bacterium]
YFHTKKPRHDHSFPTGKAKPEDLAIEVERGETLRLKVINVGIPHNLPTADQGDPKLYIIISALLPTGESSRIVKVLSYQAKNALVYKEPTYIELPWAEVKALEVLIQRKLSWKEEREDIVKKEFSFKTTVHAP